MPEQAPIYMDHHATTPVDPRVMTAMRPYFSEKFGNAASVTHQYGWEAEEAVETARAQIAKAIGAEPKEIILTSGATESDNLALKGVAEAMRERGDHLVTTAIEHKAILDSAKRLEQQGTKVTYVGVDADGIVDVDAVRRAMTDRTILVSVMHANNEVGTVQPIAAIGRLTRELGIFFHVDAAQTAGKLPINVERDGIDLLSFSAHKTYGPKGIGALYVRRRKPRVRIAPLIDGGGHEQGLRSGTLPVPLIVGFARALEIAAEKTVEENARVAALRDRLLHGIMERLDGVTVNGSMTYRLPGNLNLSFAGVEGEGVLMGVKDVALSSGSACTSAQVEPSYVLRAMGVDGQAAQSSIRFGLGRYNTADEVDTVIDRIVETVTRLRALSPIPQAAGHASTVGT
ncbi:MAG TPA: IscS subfamily cysteine desulfurase [candidate division Zixibacteria bacterium]|jgi:cysteine desulfurase